MLDTSSLQRDVVEFFDSLNCSSSSGAAAATFKNFAARQGFDAFACGDYDAGDLKRSSYAAVAWPKDFEKFYYADNKLQPDPMRAFIPLARTPLTWSDLLASSRTGASMGRSIAMSDHFGWTESLVVPMGATGRRRGIVSLKGARGRVSSHERALIGMASIVFFERMRSLRPTGGGLDRFTQRELECLASVAAGLSDKDIGKALGIAAATVHEHVENGKRKLGARTRAHAVAVAIRLGLDAP